MTAGVNNIFGQKPANPQLAALTSAEAHGTGRPAAVAVPTDGRCVPGLEIVDRPSMHGPYSAVLTAAEGEIALPESDRANVVALRQTDGLVVVLFTNRFEHRRSIVNLQVKCKQAKITVACMYESPASYIAELYHPTVHKHETVEARTAMDDLLDEILIHALRSGASDIHIQSSDGAGAATVKFRVHKRMQFHRTLHTEKSEQLVKALFAKAAADSKGVTFNPRTGQDAKVPRKVMVDGRQRAVSLRFASRPVKTKNDVILRILHEDAESRYESLEDCGYHENQRKVLTRANGRASGLVMLVGTTGSGKSTTMKVMIEEFIVRYDSTKNVVTVEDPIEYNIKGARQTGVVRDEQAGVSESTVKRKDPFALAVQWILRADPDAIYLGELRDTSTVMATQQAVQTGHKVWTTLHAQNTFVALDRMIQMGADRNVVLAPDFVNAVVYQVLLPKLCPKCRVPWVGSEARDRKHSDLEAGIVRAQGLLGGAMDGVYIEGKGCDHCKKTGVVGVVPAAEIMVPDDEMLHLLLHGDRAVAERFWRGRVNNQHPGITGVTALEHALVRMFAGEVSPMAVEADVAPIDTLSDPAHERREFARLCPDRAKLYGLTAEKELG